MREAEARVREARAAIEEAVQSAARCEDRVKELIKYKGFQVPPAELEALLITHPAIVDVAVIGVPDDEAGEIPKAFVVLKAGTAPSDDLKKTLIEHCKGKIAVYKLPREIEFIDAMPRTAVGKLLRRMLRQPGA